MTTKTAAIAQEALAIIGLCLFDFGVWQVYPPACYILTGVVFIAPFALNLRRPL